jgi:hypothetical protein
VIFHGASAIGGTVLVDGHAVTVGMNWAERFADGAWQPPRGEDVTVFLQVGTDYIPVDATDRNMAGLAAIAQLISPDVDDRVRQIGQLLKETHDTRQAGPGRRPVTAPVVPLRPSGDGAAAAREALAAVHRHLDRCKLSASTVKAYKRQTAAYVAWLDGHAAAHGDAFADLVGAEGAVTAWRRHMITARSSPSKVNQALAAVTLMYQQAGIRIAVKRARIPRPGEPAA